MRYRDDQQPKRLLRVALVALILIVSIRLSDADLRVRFIDVSVDRLLQILTRLETSLSGSSELGGQ